ncbi:hypothetical protein GWD52_06135 [Enterobacteriaceae bacterium 4M9]|nr:hypothetical protein [Enterobacteriaceae bacterium 4M9]
MLRLSFALFIALTLGGCRFTSIQRYDRQSVITWHEVINQYQRRVDLIPELISVVKSYTGDDLPVLSALKHANDSAQKMTLKLSTPSQSRALIARWQQAQVDLSQALNKTLALSAHHSDLNTDKRFLNLLVQLESRTNRINTARDRHTEAIKNYNLHVRNFPTVFLARAMNHSPRLDQHALAPVETLYVYDIDFY